VADSSWGIDDPLCRGDHKDSVVPPVPDASPSIVRHVLYLDGRGRDTPFVSTTEDEDVAERFARPDGRVWYTLVSKIEAAELRYISKAELLDLLRGKGKGDAAWPRASEVAAARALVEQNGEHLADFRRMKGRSAQDVEQCVSSLFTKERP